MNSKWKILSILWVIFIAVVCLRPTSLDEPDSPTMEALKNFAHIPLFGILTYLFIRSFSNFNFKTQMTSSMGSVLYGVLIEILQMLIPGRYASLDDVLRDALGAGIVIFILRSRLGGLFLGKLK